MRMHALDAGSEWGGWMNQGSVCPPLMQGGRWQSRQRGLTVLPTPFCAMTHRTVWEVAGSLILTLSCSRLFMSAGEDCMRGATVLFHLWNIDLPYCAMDSFEPRLRSLNSACSGLFVA